MAPMMGLVTSALGRLTETLMFEISSERFEELAEEVLTALPRELAAKIGNLAITSNDTALDENLFGLYEGVPSPSEVRTVRAASCLTGSRCARRRSVAAAATRTR